MSDWYRIFPVPYLRLRHLAAQYGVGFRLQLCLTYLRQRSSDGENSTIIFLQDEEEWRDRSGSRMVVGRM